MGRLLTGDCRTVLRQVPGSSIESCVTDPPYELGFMGKGWDASGVAFQPDTWRQVYRVLMPGAHLLAFGGTRTYHRVTCAIEDAGFEIRDGICCWMYGSGFPKSLDVGKAIDKAAGVEREVVGDKLDRPGYHLSGHDSGTVAFGRGLSSSTSESRLASALITAPTTDEARQWDGWGTALKPAWEPVIVARKPLAGTVADNVLGWGVGALNIDGCRVGRADGDVSGWSTTGGSKASGGIMGSTSERREAKPDAGGRWPANVVLCHAPDCDEDGGCVPGCPVAMVDEQSGERPSRGGAAFYNGADVYGVDNRKPDEKRELGYGDTGGASRFFPTFRYEAKAPSSERPQVGQLKHPTVKPLALIRWLTRLVTPPGGTVLDLFLGSGTTAEAALLEGFDWLGVESNVAYLPLIQARLARVAGGA